MRETDPLPGTAIPSGGFCTLSISILSKPRLLAPAKRMHVDGELLDGLGVEPSTPSRHHAAASTSDGGGDSRLVAGVEPELIGQIGRADRLIAVALRTVAGRACGSEDFAAAIGSRLVVGAVRQRQDEFVDIGDLRLV